MAVDHNLAVNVAQRLSIANSEGRSREFLATLSDDDAALLWKCLRRFGWWFPDNDQSVQQKLIWWLFRGDVTRSTFESGAETHRAESLADRIIEASRCLELLASNATGMGRSCLSARRFVCQMIVKTQGGNFPLWPNERRSGWPIDHRNGEKWSNWLLDAPATVLAFLEMEESPSESTLTERFNSPDVQATMLEIFRESAFTEGNGEIPEITLHGSMRVLYGAMRLLTDAGLTLRDVESRGATRTKAVALLREFAKNGRAFNDQEREFELFCIRFDGEYLAQTMTEFADRNSIAPVPLSWQDASADPMKARRLAFSNVRLFLENWRIVSEQLVFTTGELPFGWVTTDDKYSDAEGWPLAPIRTTNHLEQWLSHWMNSIHASRIHKTIANPDCFLGDVQRELRNARLVLNASKIALPAEFDVNPANIRDAEWQLQMLINVCAAHRDDARPEEHNDPVAEGVRLKQSFSMPRRLVEHWWSHPTEAIRVLDDDKFRYMSTNERQQHLADLAKGIKNCDAIDVDDSPLIHETCQILKDGGFLYTSPDKHLRCLDELAKRLKHVDAVEVDNAPVITEPPRLMNERSGSTIQAVEQSSPAEPIKRNVETLADRDNAGSEQGEECGNADVVLSDRLVRLKGVYLWAMSEIPDADSMTIKELFNAIQIHPLLTSEFLALLPDNPATFGTYLKRAGIDRYDSKGARRRRQSRRPQS